MNQVSEKPRNFYNLIRYWADVRPEQLAFNFLQDGESTSDTLSYGLLDQRARSIAVLLKERGLSGTPVLLQYPAGLDFIVAFFGCLYAGAIAVPAYPPTSNRSKSDRLQKLIASCGAGAVLTNSLTARDLSREPLTHGDHELPLLCTDACELNAGNDWRDPNVRQDGIAFLQYSSGSTGDPKGVIVSHGNILHNQTMIRRAMGNGTHTVFGSWLPLFHDMGLIGNVMQPLFLGVSCHLMPPIAFLQKPSRWLKLITRHRVTCSGGPNFAYDLCVDRVPEADRAELDLSSWDVAYNGAEPVRSNTLRRFASTYRPYGLQAGAIYPCYGLAEATLFVTGPHAGRTVSDLHVDAGALTEGYAKVLHESADEARPLVSSGLVWGEQSLLVVEPDTHRRCEPGRVGEIWLAGPSISRGYWRRPDADETTFMPVADAPELGTFCRTGDLGFLLNEQLYVTGRLKEVLIIRGRNHYPQDIEATVQQASPVFVPGGGAAFVCEGDEGERLVVVQEIARTALRRYDHEQAFQKAREAVAGEHGLTLFELVAIKPATLAKTSSGKIRRGFMRSSYVQGDLHRVLGARNAEPVQRENPEAAGVLLEVLREMGVPTESISSRLSLLQCGLDSLQLIDLQSRLLRRLGAMPPLEWLFEPSSIETLANRLSRLSPQVASTGELDAPSDGPTRVTPYQLAIVLRQAQTPHAPIYNLATALELDATVESECIGTALQALLARHPQLTSHIEDTGEGAFVWAKVKDTALPLRTEQAGEWSEARIDAYLAHFARLPFQLDREPPFRACLLERPGRGHLLGLGVHHVVTDLSGAENLIGDLLHLLRGEPLDTLPGFAAAQRTLERIAEQASVPDPAWIQRLAETESELDLGFAASLESREAPQGLDAELDAGTWAALSSLAQELGCTVNTLLAAAFGALLQRYTGQETLSLGMPFSVRPESLGAWSGNAVNTLPLALGFEADTTFETLTRQTAEALKSSLQNRHIPLTRVAEAVRAQSSDRRGLFSAVFVCQPERAKAGVRDLLVGSALNARSPSTVRSRAIPLAESEASFTLLVFPRQGSASLTLAFDHERVPASFASRVLGHYRGMLAALLRDPRAKVSRAEYLPAHELSLQWQAWNRQGHGLAAPSTTLVEMFAAQVAVHAHDPAVIDTTGQLTYAELDRLARQYAGALRERGIRPGDRVGIALPRDKHLPGAILGALMSGAAYVPLDLDYPDERLRYILDNSAARCVITSEAQATRLRTLGAEVLCYDPALSPGAAVGSTPDQSAYVLYTSGSTGQPKGVQVSHGSVVALLGWAEQALSPRERKRVLASTSICFDLSVFELFVPLCLGTSCVITHRILDLLDGLPASVSLINTVPSAIDALLSSNAIPDCVEVALVAGEPFRQTLVDRLYAQSRVRRVLDLYGPTEDTVYSTCAERLPGGSEVIGRPLLGKRAYVLDPQQQPVPIGLPGELYLSGLGLSAGYHARPDLTSQSFGLPSALAHLEQRTYRTGDIVRLAEDGQIVYLGRRDHQVKLRGHRIELAEIDGCLLRHARVAEAVAHVVSSDAGQTLSAYVVWQPGTPSDALALQAHLAAHLPPYMRPANIVTLERLPRTLNGKIDRKALPAVNHAVPTGEPLREGTDTMLADAWHTVLRTLPTSRDAHFVELGGSSLSAVRLRAEIRRMFAVDVPLSALLSTPVLGEQADLLREMHAPASANREQELEEIEL